MENKILNSMDTKIATIIRDWVERNFGENEAEDPSWSIQALAEEITSHAGEICEWQMQEYVAEDVYMEAKEMGIALTDEELNYATEKYMNSESYLAADHDALRWHIDDVVGQRKENK